MDYSAVNDEHSGASPWATSPQNSRFLPQDSQSEIPPSPLPSSTQYSADSPSNSRPTTADSEAERFPGKAPAPTPSENGEGRQQESPTPAQGQPATQARNPQQGRYKKVGERRPEPKYKLTAKVTGLERNGRKDPVLRFDVYVCSYFLVPTKTMLIEYTRRTCPSLGLHNSGMCEERTPNSPN